MSARKDLMPCRYCGKRPLELSGWRGYAYTCATSTCPNGGLVWRDTKKAAYAYWAAQNEPETKKEGVS